VGVGVGVGAGGVGDGLSLFEQAIIKRIKVKTTDIFFI
jgi:hypothetical protein